VRVLIRDDGLGFDFHGRGYPEPSGRRGSGIGISNIRERMRFRFGTEAVLSLRSTLGRGPRVYLSWPADH
jgi:signal transduction histidine kinase